MSVKRPSKPKGVSRGTHPRRVADGTHSTLDRSYAQKIRTDRPGLTYQSKAARASFWAQQQRQLETQEAEVITQSLDMISQGSLAESGTGFRSANIEGATLQSAPAPSGPSDAAQAQIAGLGPDGVPPPPT